MFLSCCFLLVCHTATCVCMFMCVYVYTAAKINESCIFHEQCLASTVGSECAEGFCACPPNMTAIANNNGGGDNNNQQQCVGMQFPLSHLTPRFLRFQSPQHTTCIILNVTKGPTASDMADPHKKLRELFLKKYTQKFIN